MFCRITDLRDKEVISIKDGVILGNVCDVEVDTCTAKVCAIVIFGRLKLFGLLGREEDIIIKWCDIEVIGEDTILVCFEHHHQKRRRRNVLLNLFGD